MSLRQEDIDKLSALRGMVAEEEGRRKEESMEQSHIEAKVGYWGKRLALAKAHEHKALWALYDAAVYMLENQRDPASYRAFKAAVALVTRLRREKLDTVDRYLLYKKNGYAP